MKTNIKITEELYNEGGVVNSWKCTRCQKIGKARNDTRGHECPVCK